MKQTTPIISGGGNALRLPAFFENLGHSNVILTAGGGSFGHKDGPKQGAISCGQGEESWMLWKAGMYGDVSLSDGVIEYAKTHEEIKGAFLTFQKDADQIYPGWKEKLGYTGESSVQAASFDWQKKAAAANVLSYEVDVSYYAKAPNANDVYWADVGYFSDGTSVARAGNALFRPPQHDHHMAGSALPTSTYQADVGYFVDGTSVAKAGNALFRAPMADPHREGSPLPPSGYAADVGHFVDGTAIDKAGNALFRQ